MATASVGPDKRVSIHAFRGEGDAPPGYQGSYTGVSIHAFRGEGDATTETTTTTNIAFQSTPSGGKATWLSIVNSGEDRFQSTPSGGKATFFRFLSGCYVNCFNPRLPGGRRPVPAVCQAPISAFQSTPSGGKATVTPMANAKTDTFQSTPSGGKATTVWNAGDV